MDFGEILRRGFERANRNKVASPMPASWNQIANWLKQIDTLRQAA